MEEGADSWRAVRSGHWVSGWGALTVKFEMGEIGTDSWRGQLWLGGNQGLELERWKGL